MMSRQRRLRWLALAMFAAIMLVALPAIAQEVAEGEEVISPARVLGGLAIFGAIVKTAVQVTRATFPNLHGPIVAGIAAVYGTAISAILDFRATAALLEHAAVGDVIGRVPAPVFDWFITGIAIMAVSGFLAEFAGVSGPKAAANKAIAAGGGSPEAH